jgi:hypothetical protein
MSEYNEIAGGAVIRAAVANMEEIVRLISERAEVLEVLKEARDHFIPIYREPGGHLGKADIEFVVRLDAAIKRLEAG